MSLSLYNTLTSNRDVFTPQNPDNVTIYTCGPTVYSEPHIGNWVANIRWDTLVRVLRANDFTVRRVMNITDVGHLVSDADEGEDKMQKGARREGISEWEVAERYTNRFLEGMTALNLLPPEIVVKATETIDLQIDLIKTLEEKGYTYVLTDGVYFDTSKFPKYANFAHLDLNAQKAGARVQFNDGKKNSSDFVLWRLTPAGESRTMEWQSPWGRGIPGWHIECSAMALKFLGNTIDIHTGGIDHIPVHHTNEIAQSESATGVRFANYWLHCSHLLSDGTKLAKSLNNSYTLDDIAKSGFTPMDFRMFILQSHYRTETNFSFENLNAGHNRLKHWQDIACLRHQIHDTLVDDDEKDELHDINGILLSAVHAGLEAFNDDLNTPLALSVFEKAFTAVESTPLETIQSSAFNRLLEFIDDTLGIELRSKTPDVSDDVKQLLLERQQARNSQNWQESDAMRDRLSEKGIGVNDTSHETRWYYI